MQQSSPGLQTVRFLTLRHLTPTWLFPSDARHLSSISGKATRVRCIIVIAALNHRVASVGDGCIISEPRWKRVTYSKRRELVHEISDLASFVQCLCVKRLNTPKSEKVGMVS